MTASEFRLVMVTLNDDAGSHAYGNAEHLLVKLCGLAGHPYDHWPSTSSYREVFAMLPERVRKMDADAFKMALLLLA